MVFRVTFLSSPEMLIINTSITLYNKLLIMG